jgi:sugar lactone lactonase YvrE
VTTLAGTGAAGSANGAGSAASFDGPVGIAIDSAGNLYVADTGNNLIREVSSTGVVTTLAGTGAVGRMNGPGSAASFDAPQGLAVDGAGNVYVADSGNNQIRLVSPAGVVTTLAGTGARGHDDEVVSGAASFDHPEGVAVDGAGNVYVADTGNWLIRKVTTARTVTTLAGTLPGSPFAGPDGSASFSAKGITLDLPEGIAVDASRRVYVGDTGDDTLYAITPLDRGELAVTWSYGYGITAATLPGTARAYARAPGYPTQSCADLEVCGIYGLTSGIAYTVTVESNGSDATGEPASVAAIPN